MAGESPDFDADEFRAEMRAAMHMGLPDNVELRPTFLMPFEPAYPAGEVDESGEPYDWNEPLPDGQEPPDAIVAGVDDARFDEPLECAVALGGEGTQEQTSVGSFEAKQAELVFLDIDYDKVKGFETVKLGTNTYRYDYEEPQPGLYDVTIHIVHVFAEDES